jgi:hypothetical protein
MFRYLRSSWKTLTTSSKTLTLIAGLLTTSLSPMIISPTTAHADTANCDGYGVKYAATSWLTGNGNGVNICNPGPSYTKHYCLPITGDPVGANCPTGSVWSGDEWQCVEMVNRLYLTKGWTTATWYGDGGNNSNALTNSNNLPNGITAQANGSISYVNPGDVISENNLSSGHAAIINSIDNNGTLHIKSQNADLDSSATLDNGTSLSAGNAHYSMVGWVGYAVRAIAHHPASPGPSSTPRVSALQYGSSEMDAYKLANNGTISKDTYQTSNGTWGGWSSMGTPYSGGTFTSDPVAIQFNNEMDVFAIGSDGHMYKDTWQPSPGSWSGWNSMGGSSLTGRPAAIKYSGSEMDIFSRDTSGNLYRDYWNGTTWSGLNQLSGNGGTAMASDPSVTLYGSEMDVYIRGTDSNLWKSGGYGGSSMGSLGSMGGGNLENNPVAIQYGSEMDIYSNNTSGTLIKDVWNGSSWSGWNSLTGQSFSGSPAAMQYGSGELDVYDRGITDTHIYKDTWQSGGSSWSGWNSLGGLESGDPTAIQFSTEMDVFATNGAGTTDKDTWLPANNSWSGFLALYP